MRKSLMRKAGVEPARGRPHRILRAVDEASAVPDAGDAEAVRRSASQGFAGLLRHLLRHARALVTRLAGRSSTPPAAVRQDITQDQGHSAPLTRDLTPRPHSVRMMLDPHLGRQWVVG